MPNQNNKVTLVNTLIEGNRNENSASTFDIIVLSQDFDVNDTGRVIAVQGQGDIAGYVHDTVSYAYVVKGNDTSLTISGNYGLNDNGSGSSTKEYSINYWSSVSNTMGAFSATHNAPAYVEVSKLYNAYHFAYNNDDHGDNAAGALKFTGDNSLVLTAQAGSATSNYYWHASDFDEDKNKRWKVDDDITLVSVNYGMYSPWDYSSGESFVYGQYLGGPSAPGKTTASYTIHSTGSKLTVKSDLVGSIKSRAAALHTGYYVKNSDPTKPAVATNDSSDNVVDVAGVKVKELVLNSNFRANVEALNNDDVASDGLDGDSGEKSKIYEWEIVTITTPGSGEGGSGGSSEKQAEKVEEQYKENSGTTISGFASPTASNNKITSYGVVADGAITLNDGVWSGAIFAEASDVTINANYKDVASTEHEGMAAAATGNQIGAYGIKAGTINIAKMGALQKDYNGINSSTGDYESIVKVVANNVQVSAVSIGESDYKGGRAATSASVGVTVVAAAIDATTVNIGEMTSDFKLHAESTGHYAEAVIESGHINNTGSLSASNTVFGIRGGSVNFGIFDGSIKAVADTDFTHKTQNFTTVPSASSAATGIAAGTLTASRKFAGSINATHLGIYTSSDFKVTGVISTDIVCSVVGINTLGHLTADAFAGDISNPYAGISVGGSISSNNKASGDAFDITGKIKGNVAITSLSALNLRISGTVDAGSETAVNAEKYCNKNEWYFYEGGKFNDHVELASTAVVKGNINLGQLTNTVVINSSARLDGVVYSDGGSVNTTFVLDDKVNSCAAYVVNKYDTHDTLIKGSQLININMSYATNGTYKLIQYSYHDFDDDTGVHRANLWDYWQKNEFQLAYLDKVYNVSFDNHNGTTHSGSVTINDGNGNNATFTVIYKEGEDSLSVKVEGLGGDFAYAPQQLGVTDGSATYVTVAQNENTFTLDWAELDTYLKANIESTLSGEATYGLEKVTNYSLRYKFVDAEGNDVVTVDENGSRVWNELDFYEVSGTKLTINNVPEGAVDVVYEIIPVDDTVTAVESKDAKSKLETAAVDANGNLVISWADLDAEDVGLTDFSSIDLVEIVYTLYGRNGKVIGSKNQSKFITMDEYNALSYTFEDIDAGSRIHWELKFHDVVNAQTNSVDASPSGDKVINWSYLAGNNALADNEEIISYNLTYKLAGGETVTVENINGTNFEIAGSKGGTVESWSVEANIDINDGVLTANTATPAEGLAALDWTAEALISPAAYYVLTYNELDAEGNVIGDAVSVYIDGAETTFEIGELNNKTASVVWSVEAHSHGAQNLGTAVQGGDFAFNGESGVKTYTQQYDAEKSQLTINWKELHNSLLQDEDGDGSTGDKLRNEFNFANGILNYELEYQLYDENGNKIGNTIVVTLSKDTYQHSFNGVEEGTRLDWRIRIVGNETGGLVSKWSDWNVVDVHTLPSEGFNFDKFSSSVRSVYSTVADEAVPNSIAELEWSGLVSAEAVRCYEIEYFRRVDQVTLDEAKAAGFDSVEDYIVSNDFFDAADEVYTKVVSGKTVVLSNLKNNGFVYWRIRAIDETANLRDTFANGSTSGVSDWVAGATFCVHQNGESIAPDMQKNQQLGCFVMVNKPDTFDGNADIDGYLCWNAAIEQDSGMRDYIVEFRNQAGQVVATKTVQAADAKTRCIGQWVVDEDTVSLYEGDFEAEVVGETGEFEVKAKVEMYQEEVELADGTVEMQTKYKTVLHFTTNIDLTGKTITFRNGTSEWMVEVYDKTDNENGFSFQKFDYELSLDDVDMTFDPSKGYSYTIKATDNFSNSANVSTIIGQIDVDNKRPVFIDGGEYSHFVSNKLSENPNEETLLNGFICWNGAFEGETDIIRYVVALKDEKGNILKDRDDRECIDIVDLTNDPTRVEPTPRSIITLKYTNEELPLDEEYTVLDANGNELDFTIREVTVDGRTMVELQITGENDLTGTIITVNSQSGVKSVALNSENCKFFEYSIDLAQWNLDAPRYTYDIYAEDSLGNRTQEILQGSFVLDDQIPVFTDEATGVTRLTFETPAIDDITGETKVNGKITWNAAIDNYGVKEYVVEISTDGKTYTEFKRVSADDPAGEITQVIYQNNNLKLDNTYTITVDSVVYNGRVEKRNGSKCLIWDGEGNWGGKTAVISGSDGSSWSITMNSSSCTVNVYTYAAELNGLTGSIYKYRIKALDFMGNSSSYIYGKDIVADSGAPEFYEESATVTVINGENNATIIPTVSWNAAEDKAGDLGVRYYAVYVAEANSQNEVINDWGEAKKIVQAEAGVESYAVTFEDLNLPPGLYQYKVVAYDYFGNTAELMGSFDTPDNVPPVGNFTGFNAEVSTQFVTNEIRTPLYYSTGQPQLDAEGNQLYQITYEKLLIDAKVVIKWSDNFDDAVHYKVAISNTSDFEEGSELYSFWTTAEEAATTQMVFSAATTGRPVGIFENMDTVYYRVFAYDASYNKATASSGLQSFVFEDESYGKDIKESALTAPKNINTVVNYDEEAKCHTDEVALSWTTSGSQLGVYYYEVELINAAGEVEKISTLDAESDRLTTDSKPSNRYYTMNVGANSTTVEINDLKKFFGWTTLDDGTYKVRINAYSASSNKPVSSQWQEFVVDTQRPDPVKVTACSMIPSGINDEDQLNLLMIEWEKAANPSEIAAYDIYWRVSTDEKWECCRIEDGNATSISALPKDKWPEVNFSSVDQSCEFYIVAIDKQNNISEWMGENLFVAMAEDKFANFRNGAEELVKNVEGSNKKFAELDRIEAGDVVGIGDLKDYFVVTTDNASALTLTVNELSAVIKGATDDIKIVIYEGNSSKAWKTFSVKDLGRVASDLLLKADTAYTFCVSSAYGNKAAARYNLVLDKTELPTDNNAPVAFENNGNNTGWVGFGDTVDRFDLTLTESGKYSFTLDGVAASTKLAIFEVGSNKAITTITASEKNVNGVTTKELLLEKGNYYVDVTAANANAYGTDYNVTMETLETYPAGLKDGKIIDARALPLGGVDSGEWVGFGDAADYRVMEFGPNGGVVNFTVSHVANSDEAVKVAIYQYDSGNSKNPYKSVKTVTLAKKDGSVSTGNLFLTGEYGGTYYVEITAPGNGKGQNSSYELATNGYIISDDMVNDSVNDTVGSTSDLLAVTDSRNGWVGVGDTVDNYKFELTAADAGVYEFQLSGVNGKEIKAAVGYLKDGKFKALKSENGTAGADELIMSLNITADMINEANGMLYVQVSANGKNANSLYNLTAEKLQFSDPETLSVSTLVSSKVGLGDANKVDEIELVLAESGFYDLNVSGAENPLKVQLVEVDANGKTKSIKNISLTAANSDGAISGVFLDQSKTYKLVVTATGAAQGKNSNYSVALESQMKTLVNNAADGKVNAADMIDAYAYTVSNPGVYSFVLNGVNGNNIKMSIIDAATGKVIKSITPGAKSNQAALSLYFDDAGDYIVKLESAGKAKESDYQLEVIDRAGELVSAYDEWEWSESHKVIENGWVGLKDSEDNYNLEIGATGIYDIKLDNLDNNAKVTVYENGKSIGSASGTDVKAGILSGLLLDKDNTYTVQVKAGSSNGTKDTGYSLTLEQILKSKIDDDTSLVPSETGEQNWVGFGDSKDYYTFTAADVNNITVNLNGEEKGDVKVVITTLDGTKVVTVKTLTVNGKTWTASTGDLCLVNGQTYNVEVSAVKANKGVNADYTLSVDQWNFADYEDGKTADDSISTSSTLKFDEGKIIAESADNAVWSGDKVDYYMVEVASDGSYTLKADLLSLNGNAVKISIGTEKNGKFSSLQSVTGKAGSDVLQLSRNLTAGTYYIKVESNGKNSAAEYTVSLTNNNNRADGVFNNGDDTWQLVADIVDDNTVKINQGNITTLSDWVGFGDATDVFELKFDENGVVSFDWNEAAAYGEDALLSKEITLTLTDVNGKSVALAFDKENGIYSSKNILMADVEYYLSVENNKPNQNNIDYSIDIKLA